MAYGYWNRWLEVDLTNRTTKEVTFDDDHARMYIGGLGFATRILYDRVPLGADPLGPDNVLTCMYGPLSGTDYPGQKSCWNFKSPIVGDLGIGRTRHGGAFGPEVRFAGWDGLIFTGKADSLVYLYIKDDEVQIKDATFLAGKDTQATEMMIKEQLGDHFVRVACCGPAGENLVRFASIQSETVRSAARTGGGAVMGSKNLKAVAVRGTQAVPLADPASFYELTKQTRYQLTRARGLWPFMAGFRRYHTNTYTGQATALKNFNDSGDVLAATRIGGERQERLFHVRYGACSTFCDGECFSMGVVRGGKYAGMAGETSEFDTGPTILNPYLSDVRTAISAVALLDKFGMDGSSTGNTIGWAMECYENGLITEEDTGGLALEWGDGDLVIKLLHMIAFREGFGDILAEGTVRAAAYLEEQKGLEPGTLFQYACTARNLELAGVDQRWMPSVIPHGPVGQATSARGGGDHLSDFVSWDDCLGVCYFGMAYRGIPLDTVVQLVKYATGWEYTQENKLEDHERIVTLQKAFWSRMAWPTLPSEVEYCASKMYTQPIKYGPLTGAVVDMATFEQDRANYYAAHGWDERGIPTKATLAKLGLDDVIDSMEAAGMTLT